MTQPTPAPGEPQGRDGSRFSPYAAYGRFPESTAHADSPYGQAPTPAPAGQAPYAYSEQLAIPTQTVSVPPGGPIRTERPTPPMSASSSQYQPHQPYAAPVQQYSSGAATAPAYPAVSPFSHPGLPGSGPASPQPIGVGHRVPWRGEKSAALVTMLVTCALQIIVFITHYTSLGQGSDWMLIVIMALMFISLSPAIWWLFFALHHLLRNQPVFEMSGLSLWFGLGVLTLSTEAFSGPHSGILNTILVLSFIITTIGAVLTARLNQRLKNPQPWTTTLALGSCQFMLFDIILGLSELAWAANTAASKGQSIKHYTAGTWLMWSDSGGTGVPLVPGLILSMAIISLSAASLLLGRRAPHRLAFKITSVTAASLLTLHNVFVLLIYGLPTSGTHAYNPSGMGIVVLANMTIGIILIGSLLAAGHRIPATPSTQGVVEAGGWG